MREILFRGKRIDNGKWVIGNLFIPDKEDTPTQICIGTNVIRITYDIIPETVGQWTGLLDKNGQKIFEGDIVKHYNHCTINRYTEDIGRIFYHDETCRFLRTSKLFPGDYLEIHDDCKYEIIGNMYNTETLEEQK